MPQIDQLVDIWSSQIFWTLVFFGITFFVIGRGMVPKVMETVGMRDKQISDDLAAAQAARDAADTQEEAWRERENANRAKAQGLIAEAKASAHRAILQHELDDAQNAKWLPIGKAMVEKVGADNFIPKFDPDELAAAVQTQLKDSDIIAD